MYYSPYVTTPVSAVRYSCGKSLACSVIVLGFAHEVLLKEPYRVSFTTKLPIEKVVKVWKRDHNTGSSETFRNTLNFRLSSSGILNENSKGPSQCELHTAKSLNFKVLSPPGAKINKLLNPKSLECF